MGRLDLNDRPIVITGASAGIGRATALECTKAGMPVALAARRQEKLDEVARAIEQMGGNAIAVQCDVARTDDCRRLIERAVESFGSVYAVFANAGYGHEGGVHEISDAEMRAIFDTNFFGTLNTIRPAVERMLRTDGDPRGHILICSSCLARFTIARQSAYTATKAAQAHVGAAMRAELRPQRIHVSTVHPIGTATEFFHQMKREGSGDKSDAQMAPDLFTQTPELVARKVVACLKRPKPEVWTGPKGALTRTAAGFMTIFPRFGAMVAAGGMKEKKKT